MASIRCWCFALLTASLAVLFAGCESRPDRRAMSEEARHSVPPMAGDQAFFGGVIVAHITVKADTGARGSGGDSDSGGGRGYGGGGGRHGGGRGGGSGRMRQSADGGDGSAPSPTMRASAMPAAMLRLRLENTSTTRADVEVRDLNSELGNFAVRPEKLIIMPGESEEPDPMESLLGVDSFALPVTLTLRWNGKTETKVVTLQLVQPPATASPLPAIHEP